jgi:hypothetical protein
LNDTQAGVLNIIFKYSDDKSLPIVDFNDLKKVLNYLTEGQGSRDKRRLWKNIRGDIIDDPAEDRFA